MGYIVISLISFETSKHLPLETIYPVENFIPVLTEDELIDRGIRSSRCFASSVDKNGIFAHEPEYDHEHSEPFIRKTYILKSIPNRLWKNTWKEKNHILEIIRLTVNLRKNEYLISKVIDEVKEHMEYVCMIAYAYFEEVPSEAWAEKIVPVVMGLPKCKYNKLVENLNS
jgi:hypothetical protein